MFFKQLVVLSATIALFLTVSCGGGGSSNPIVPTNPVDLLGDWQGTYENNVVGVGIIQVSFFMSGGTLRVTYDLQNGEVVGTSNVSINGREITFIGIGTRLQEVQGTCNDAGTRITGTLTIAYTLSGTYIGPLELNKI